MMSEVEHPIMNPAFAEHAAPEAIMAEIVRAKRKRRSIDLWIEELHELLGRREAEKELGHWGQFTDGS